MCSCICLCFLSLKGKLQLLKLVRSLFLNFLNSVLWVMVIVPQKASLPEHILDICELLMHVSHSSPASGSKFTTSLCITQERHT